MQDLFSGRFGRYKDSALTLGGLLGRFLFDKWGVSINHERYAGLLTEALGQLKGPTMKIGQILATVPDMLPAEYAEAFLSLQSNAPPMGWLFVKRRMRSELGESWEDFFETFSKEANFAASLGQVHRATLKTGEVLACKLQYPQMEEVVETDLRQLALFCKVYEKAFGGVMTASLQEEIKARLQEELDYHQEAQHLKWFQKALEGEGAVQVPNFFPSLSTKRLLTLSWLEGHPFRWLESQDLALREFYAPVLFRAWYKPLYHFGLLHGDPHLGNYTVDPLGGKLNLLDFGCVRLFPAFVVEGILQLYRALQSGSLKEAASAYEALGFEELDHEMIEALNLWARFLYGPLLEDRVRPLEETFSGEPGKAVAGQVHEILRKKGGIKPPRFFVFLDRAAVGIGSALIRLRVSLNWHKLFEELIEGFSPDEVASRQKALTEAPNVSQ